jgi:cysteine desulfurase
MKSRIYLDHNATAPVHPAVIDAVAAALAQTGNASSVHGAGRQARRVVEEARERVAALVGARPRQIIFTSGGTEANNLALTGTGRPVFAAAAEHSSVLQAAQVTTLVPVDGDGRVDTAGLERLLAGADRPAVVAAMLANNETGVVNDVAAVAAAAHAHGALVHADAIQAAGKIAVDVAALGADMLSLSAHKLGGPQGVGALVVGEQVQLKPLLNGGGQELGRRAGTEPVALIAGFGKAAECALDALRRADHIQTLRDRLERKLPAATVFGAAARRLPNTSCLAMPGVSAETQVMHFDLAGIAISAGSACSSGKVKASHVLAAMGVASELARCAIRVSLGPQTTAEEIDRFVDVWTALRARLGAPAAATAA